MNNSLYLRQLSLKDAETSFRWRNNPRIWTYTKFRPANEITLEIEQNWLSNCLKRENECRLAICITGTDEYIGNVQIIGIRGEVGEFHLFIGEEKHWGKGFGKQASTLILDYAFEVLNLKTVTLEVHQSNIAAIVIYKKMGFEETLRTDGSFVEMKLDKPNYYLCKNSLPKPVTT